MSVNKVLLMGNLGQDPELRYTANNTPVCTFSLATSEFRTDREGNRQEMVEWHRIVVWSKVAENCAKYLAKGRPVFIEGRIQTRSWDDKSGQKRYTTEIVAQNVQFLGTAAGARENNQSPGSSPYQQGQSPSFSGDSMSGNHSGSTPEFQPSSYPMHDAPNLDDIPF